MGMGDVGMSWYDTINEIRNETLWNWRNKYEDDARRRTEMQRIYILKARAILLLYESGQMNINQIAEATNVKLDAVAYIINEYNQRKLAKMDKEPYFKKGENCYKCGNEFIGPWFTCPRCAARAADKPTEDET
jgi:hypothetical protein